MIQPNEFFIMFSDEVRPLKWTPRSRNLANMVVRDGAHSAESFSNLKSSSLGSPWLSQSLKPEIIIDFDEQVTILDVVLTPSFLITQAPSPSIRALNEPSSYNFEPIPQVRSRSTSTLNKPPSYNFENYSLTEGERIQPTKMQASFYNIG